VRTVRFVGLFCLCWVPLLACADPLSLARTSTTRMAQESCTPDPESLFSAEEMTRWSSEHRQKRALHFLRVGSVLAFYALFFSLGLNRHLKNAAERATGWLYGHPGLGRLGGRWPRVRQAVRVPEILFGDRQWLVVLLYALGFVLLFRLVFFPYLFYRTYWYELQTGLSNYTVGLWFLDYAKALCLGTVRYALMVFGIYGLLVRVGTRWWLFLWAGVSLGIFGWVYLVPYRQMVYQDFRPLEQGELRLRLENLVREQGLTLEEIHVVNASLRTQRVNAYVTGKGASRRIVLFDTLLDTFTPREITLILAHELVHWKEEEKMYPYLLFSATVFLVLFVVHRVLIRASRVRFFQFSGPADVAGLPLMLLTFFLLFMILRPANLCMKRSHELETDRKSLEMVCDPEAFVLAHTKLARLNHSEIDPHPLVVFLFYSHPPLLQRLALATCQGCGGERGSREPGVPETPCVDPGS